jgi:signal peptidase I
MRASARGVAVAGLALLAGCGLAVAARRARLEPLLVQGDSMRPALPPGQRIAVGPVRGTLRRGEVVLLRRAGREMVKRVVGLPGEHVLLAGGRLEVDGRHVAEPWTDGQAPALPAAVELDVHLEDDEVVVLGDSRRQSTDSRSFGPVRLDDVIGVVRFAYWPPRRITGTGRAHGGSGYRVRMRKS